MNKEYVYNNGKALIIDDNNIQREEDYYDGLEDVLIKENVIEELENRKIDLEKELKKIDKKSKHSKRKALLNTIIPILFFVGVMSSIISTYFDYIGEVQVGPISARMLAIIVGVPLIFLSCGDLIATNYLCYKNIKKHKRGIEVELELLGKQLIKEKELLQELQKNKTNNKNDDLFYATEVNDIGQLNSLYNMLILYYNLGYQEEKYLDYYKKGILKKKLAKYYEENRVNFASDYFEEKGPRLVKKR